MHTGRVACEDGGNDQGDALKSQGMPKIASKPAESRREAWDGFSLTALGTSLNQPPCWCLHLCLWPLGLGGETLLFYEPPSSWCFVTATLADQHRCVIFTHTKHRVTQVPTEHRHLTVTKSIRRKDQNITLSNLNLEFFFFSNISY